MKNKHLANKRLVFNPSAKALTLGVELELQVLDGESLLLTPKAHDIISEMSHPTIQKEFFMSTLELTTGICNNVHEAKEELLASLKKIHAASSKLNLKISSTGTHPEADYRDRSITPSSRYYELAERNQWLIRRMAVYGMHVHIGMPSADEAISFNNFLLHFVPHVLALSASSPFWQRMDTGLSAARPTLYESMPTCGMPYVVKNWKQFQKLYDALVRFGSIQGMKDLWWDIRPSPTYGTIELRICDEPATFKELVSIVAFVHLLGHWYFDNRDEWNALHKNINTWILRENKWRTIRFGLGATIIVQRDKKPAKLSLDILYWLEKFQPYVKKLGYEKFCEGIQTIIKDGNSSTRQHAIFNSHKDLHEVTRFNVSEFESDLLE